MSQASQRDKCLSDIVPVRKHGPLPYSGPQDPSVMLEFMLDIFRHCWLPIRKIKKCDIYMSYS